MIPLIFLWVLLAFSGFWIPDPALAYIGPGAGFVVMSSFLAIFGAVLSASLALFSWPIRYGVRAIKGRRAFARSRVKKFVILGLDGLDPDLTEAFMAKGKLPNLVKLRDRGCFKRLGTTIPFYFTGGMVVISDRFKPRKTQYL